jgi:hypothetical protein
MRLGFELINVQLITQLLSLRRDIDKLYTLAVIKNNLNNDFRGRQ